MFSKKLRRAVFILFVVLGVMVMGVVGITMGYNYVLKQNDRLNAIREAQTEITKDTPNAVMVLIESGDTTSIIAEKLEELTLIENTTIFSLLSKYNGFDGEYQVGTHYLTPDLSYDEIMHHLTLRAKTVTIRFREGLSYIQVKEILRENGLQFNETKLDEMMDSSNDFVDYRFVEMINVSDDRDFILNGYLFPDQYDFDVNASERTILNTFLRNTARKIPEEYYERAAYLGMTMDEVIVLASFIQAEAGGIEEMFDISGVFHNRLKNENFLKLESCASANYIREIDGLPRVWSATLEDIELDHPYNTYYYQGLPPGPICMPGQDAIAAALYPSNHTYYYFCSNGEGKNVFSATRAEHEQKVAMYSPLWTDEDTE